MHTKRIGYQSFRRKPERALIDLSPKNEQRLEALTSHYPDGLPVTVEIRLVLPTWEQLSDKYE